MAVEDVLIGERELSKLKWRCRRGLLENDLIIERFFRKYEASLSTRQAQALNELMDLSDNDLLDLHLGRKTLAQVEPDLARDDVSEVLSMLRENRLEGKI
ncbi:MAG: succinate dehydrogenase assembly factor 2 [Gammaproteobacteria bacterium]|nr:succinate dehydrogenase assembly factor 2 [Gammaproteobacteria bacterium]MBU0788545.1 succinate dehydrogenase assembly factor 2 [Gammaproteobacteria bacterium]MBU0815631.1 succinate dehydrogenase assembly factor 2 [Gammaproteobacteria bacterium]MBU1788161.1 succinate dehydrogenase assembly factor 2 [Gammaproteobacteria bacterium]